MKLWDKGSETNKAVERFTVGNDRHLDARLLKADVAGTIAHAQMLAEQGLLTKTEFQTIKHTLLNIFYSSSSSFTIESEFEDLHSKLEYLLCERAGEAGKKVHAGRSRNDQVLTALKIYFREEIETITRKIYSVFRLLMQKSAQHKDVLLPGYTHLQVAMPSSFGLWFAAYAESLTEDLLQLQSTYRLCNTNPLGSAAGYGTSFPLNRTRTTELLGFERLSVNVIAAQMNRGKCERAVATGIAAVAATLAKFSMDCCLFLSQNFRFIELPDNFTTGSSIMPHKKNPDVFELIRAKCNRLQSLPNDISIITTNLSSGYHRDYQAIKDLIFPAIDQLKECLDVLLLAIGEITPVRDILEDEKYRYLFSVEDVNKLVLKGVPFRDAYKQLATEISSGKYQPSMNLEHTHEGSIGNLCLEQIEKNMNHTLGEFRFREVNAALEKLLTPTVTETYSS